MAVRAEDTKRTWSDATGKFTIDATLVDRTEKDVRLQKADGRIVSVPISKLSQPDQEFLAAQAKNEADNPFAGGELPDMKSAPKPRVVAPGVLASFQCADVANLTSKGADVVLQPNLPFASLSPDPGPDRPTWRNFSIVVPSESHYERMKTPIMVGSSGKFAAAINQYPNYSRPEKYGRVYLARYGDLKPKLIIDAAESIELLDHHPSSGLTLAVVHKESDTRGGGQFCVIEGLEEGNAAVVLRRVIPSMGSSSSLPRIEWAKLIDEDHVVAYLDRKLACWNLTDNELVYVIDRMPRQIDLSPGREYLAIGQSKKVVFVSSVTGESLASFDLATASLTPEVCFDPSGTRLAIGSGNELSLLDLRNGNVEKDFKLMKHIGDLIGWVSEQQLLTASAGLIDFELEMPIWDYSGVQRDSIVIDGGLVRFQSATEKTMFALEAPHGPAQAVAKKLAAGGDSIYIIEPGTEVSFTIEATAEADEAQIRQSLEKAATRVGWVVTDNATTKLIAKIGRGKREEVEYYSYKSVPDERFPRSRLGFGSLGPRKSVRETTKASITPFTMSFEVQRNGQTLWRRQSRNHLPQTLYLQENQTLQEAISQYEKPTERYFEYVSLPERIPKPEVSKMIGRSHVYKDHWNDMNR